MLGFLSNQKPILRFHEIHGVLENKQLTRFVFPIALKGILHYLEANSCLMLYSLE